MTYTFMKALSAFFSCFLIIGIAQADNIAKFGAYEFSPYFSSQSGELGGIWIEDVESLLESVGMTLDGEMYPPARLIQNIEQGVVDFSIFVKRPDLKNLVYSDVPFAIVNIDAYFHAGENLQFRRANDPAMRIGMLKGYEYGGLRDELTSMFNNVEIIEAYSRESLAKLLMVKRADVIVDYEIIGIQDFEPLANLAIKSEVLKTDEAFFAVSIRSEGWVSLLEGLNKALSIRENKGL